MDAHPVSLCLVTSLYILYKSAFLDDLKMSRFLNPLLRNRIGPAARGNDAFPIMSATTVRCHF